MLDVRGKLSSKANPLEWLHNFGPRVVTDTDNRDLKDNDQQTG